MTGMFTNEVPYYQYKELARMDQESVFKPGLLKIG